MQPSFKVPVPVHIAILIAIPSVAAILAAIQRLVPGKRKMLRTGLAVTLLLNSLVWYGYLAARGWLAFPNNLPLQLCDATLCVTIIALFTLNPVVFDLAYYGALAGTSMALLTPNLLEHFPSFSTVDFFVAHGLVVVGVLYLVWSGQARPQPGSIWRAMIGLNVFAAAVGLFDLFFKTNYMYLRAKPENFSLLSLLGPWPWYIGASEAVALLFFMLLYLPFRRSASRPAEMS